MSSEGICLEAVCVISSPAIQRRRLGHRKSSGRLLDHGTAADEWSTGFVITLATRKGRNLGALLPTV